MSCEIHWLEKLYRHTKIMSNFLEIFKLFWINFSEMMRQKKAHLIVFIITFVIMGVILVFDVVTSQTIFSLSLEEYSLNQISDITIIAERSIESRDDTTDNSVSVIQGEKIIAKGFPITEEQYQKLKLMAETPAYLDFKAITNGFLALLLLSTMIFFLFSTQILGKNLKLKEAIFFALSLVVVVLVTILTKKSALFENPFNIAMLVPASFFVMLITIMFDVRLAVYASILFGISVLYASGFSIPSSMYTIFTCCISVFISKRANKRIQITLVALVLAITNVLSAILIRSAFDAISGDYISILIGVAINGFISGICLLGFLTPLEYLFNTASVFRLLDLSDTNSNIMKRMLIKAPGTYNHSLLVASLSENACNKIGANGVLARVASYYHDIGKLEQPEYFVENQRAGNKHDEINPRLSASVIRNHVKKGVEKCYQLHLPQEIIDIVAQHHGCSTIFYFYAEAKKIDPTVSREEYSYMGVKPSTKESAVVMISDTVEAACRTLKDPSVSRLKKFITKLIMDKIDDGQMENANLTFDDINKIRDALVDFMAAYYHSRIEYPNIDDSENSDKSANEANLHNSIEKEVIHE